MCRPFYLLGESYGDVGMGISRLFGLCAALLFASSVNAANIIDLGPSDYRNYGSGPASHASGGVRSSFGQTVRLPPTLNTLNVTRNPVIPYGSIANGLRNFTRINPASVAASAAVTGLFLAVDWVWNESVGEWQKTGELSVEPNPDYMHWYADTAQMPQDMIFSDPIEACDEYMAISGRYPAAEPASRFVAPNVYSCMTANNPQGTLNVFQVVIRRRGLTCPEGSFVSPETNSCVAEGYIDLDPSDWSTLENELPGLPAQQVASAAGDTQRRIGDPLPGYTDTSITGPSSVSGPDTTSTSTDPVTGDTIVTNTSTTTNISYGDTTITTTNTTTTTTYQNGQETSTTVTTETPGELPVTSGGGAAGDWPGFCEWASVVCDWFNWTQEDPPPEQDLPTVIDDDFYQEKTISFGAKSCPPDHQINLAPFLPNPVAVSFQPLCDFAGLIYFMVMAASYIIAAYITIGVARNG